MPPPPQAFLCMRCFAREAENKTDFSGESMDEKTYKNHIESAELAEDFSLEDILDEYRVPVPDYAGGESLGERSKRIVLEALEEAGAEAPVAAVGEIVDELVGTEEPAEDAVGESEEIIPETAASESAAETAEIPQQLSEYEIQALVDSDERDSYASGDIDFSLGDEEEYTGEEAPVVARDKKRRRRGKGGTALSPVLALLALITHKRSQRATADSHIPTTDTEDAEIPEMEAEKAAKLYAGHIMSLRLRSKIALGVSIVMLYITFAFYSFLPLAGAMKGPVGASLTLLILLLTVMICGLDVFSSGMMNLFRGNPGYESLASVSCVLAALDAAAIVFMRTGDFGLPFCSVAALSVCGAMLGNYWSCKALRYGFKLASSDSSVAVTAECGISGKGSAVFKSQRGIAGFIRRSEEADLAEVVYGRFTYIALAAALVFSALAAILKSGGESFVHCLSAMVACSAALGGGICFAQPFAATAKKLHSVGAAISGWSGLRDIGKCRGVVISDSDIFPQGTVEIAGIRVLQDQSADKVIGYTGSVIAASANGLSGPFMALMRRNGYGICRVENFTPHDGGGITAVVNGENVMVGNAGFMNLMGIRVPQKMSNRNTVFTAISGELVGLFDMDYKPLPAVQDSLGALLRSGYDAVFALRDFNMTPDALRNKFHVSGDGFNLPSYPDRYRISGSDADPQSPVSAIIVREGMVPVVEMSKRARRLYFCSVAAVALAAALGAVGLLLMFFAAWKGAFMDANAAKAALIMLLCLIPNVIAGIWLER